jgi:hypothetical protein
MTFRTASMFLAVASTALASVTCSSEPEAQSPTDVQQGYGQQGYGQQGYGQQGYGQQGSTTPAATATATTVASPIALPCQADSGCGTHKCNLATQTCAFPCTGPADCQSGLACTMGICLPGASQ